MFGFTFFSGSMLAGQQLAKGLSFGEFLFSVMVGDAFLGVFGGFLAYIGCKTKKTMSELAKDSFGKIGAFYPSFLIAITQIGWYGVGISMFAVPVALRIFPRYKVAVYVSVILFGSIMTFSTYYGIRAITRLSYIAVPVILVLGCAIILYAIINEKTNILYKFGNGESISVIEGIQVVIGTYISGAITTPNFTKYAEDEKGTTMISFLAFFLGNSLMFIFGAFSYVLVGGSDIFDIFVYFQCFILGIIVLGLNVWSSCDNGLYSAALEVQNITGIDYQKTIPCIGLFSMIFSLWLYSNFCDFLLILNKTLPPIGVVLIFDYLINGKSIKENRKCNWCNLIVAIMGALISLLFEYGIMFLNGIIVFCGCCFLWVKYKN